MTKHKNMFPSSLEKLYIPETGSMMTEKGKYDPPPHYTPTAIESDVKPSPDSPPGVIIQQVHAPPRPSDYLNLALCTCCFCPVLGLLAVICSLTSKSAGDAGKYEVAGARGRASRNISTITFVLGLLLFAAAVPIFFLPYWNEWIHGEQEVDVEIEVETTILPEPVELFITEDVCDPFSSNFNVYTCVGLATARVECNKRSPRFNLYRCLRLDESCEPNTPDYDPVVCDSRVEHDLCNPFTGEFDPEKCADINLSGSRCNPFSELFDEQECLWMEDEDPCNPFGISYDVSTCLLSIEQRNRGSNDCNGSTGPRSASDPGCSNTPSPACDIHSEHFDPFICLGKKR